MTASPPEDASELAEATLASFRRAVEAVAASERQIQACAREIARRYEAGGRLVYIGAGASGLIAAEDAAELPGTFGLDGRRIAILLAGGASKPFVIDAAAEDDAKAGVAEVERLGDLSRDAAIAVSASGATPYTVAAAAEARRRGAYVVALAGRPGSPLSAEADASLTLEVGAEAVAGSTRLAAGAAQKCALGLISTLVGLELGHLHRGLMVNLRADNEKLRGRALGIVARISGADEAAARAALAEAGGDVKLASLIACGAEASAARAALAAARGRVSAALTRLGDAAASGPGKDGPKPAMSGRAG